jgi:hypothetical protein
MPVSPHTLARHCAPRTVIHLDAHRPVVMVRDDGTEPRTPEQYATVEAINAGLRMVEHHDATPGCTGPCDQGRKLCPCPTACGISANDTKDAGQKMPPEQAFGEFLGNVIGWGLLAVVVLIAIALKAPQ